MDDFSENPTVEVIEQDVKKMNNIWQDNKAIIIIGGVVLLIFILKS